MKTLIKVKTMPNLTGKPCDSQMSMEMGECNSQACGYSLKLNTYDKIFFQKFSNFLFLFVFRFPNQSSLKYTGLKI